MATTKQQLALYTDEERATAYIYVAGAEDQRSQTRLLRILKRHYGRRPLRTPSKAQRHMQRRRR